MTTRSSHWCRNLFEIRHHVRHCFLLKTIDGDLILYHDNTTSNKDEDTHRNTLNYRWLGMDLALFRLHLIDTYEYVSMNLLRPLQSKAVSIRRTQLLKSLMTLKQTECHERFTLSCRRDALRYIVVFSCEIAEDTRGSQYDVRGISSNWLIRVRFAYFLLLEWKCIILREWSVERSTIDESLFCDHSIFHRPLARPCIRSVSFHYSFDTKNRCPTLSRSSESVRPFVQKITLVRIFRKRERELC